MLKAMKNSKKNGKINKLSYNINDKNAEKYAKRKEEHVNIVLGNDVTSPYNYWDDVELVHNSLPEIDFDIIDTEIRLLRKMLRYPLVITGMTGGYDGGEKINRALATLSSEFNIGLGVGSERGALLSNDLKKSYSCIKDYDIPIKIANIGAPQLVDQKDKKALSDDDISMLVDLINADVVAIHLNYLQEVVQPEGDLNSTGCIDRIEQISKKFPTIVKETGAGISRQVALLLRKTKIMGIDTSGKGGTSFAKVEKYRAYENDSERYSLGNLFGSWGVPAPISIINGKLAEKEIIGSGGIRNGLDAAKAISMGADAAGFARAILQEVVKGDEYARQYLNGFIKELKVSMYLTGSKNIDMLKRSEHIIKGECSQWIKM